MKEDVNNKHMISIKHLPGEIIFSTETDLQISVYTETLQSMMHRDIIGDNEMDGLFMASRLAAIWINCLRRKFSRMNTYNLVYVNPNLNIEATSPYSPSKILKYLYTGSIVKIDSPPFRGNYKLNLRTFKYEKGAIYAYYLPINW